MQQTSSTKCLVMSGDYAQLTQDCDESSSRQMFYFTSSDHLTSSDQIKANSHPNMCLDARYNPIRMNSCARGDSSNLRFQLFQYLTSTGEMRSTLDGRCFTGDEYNRVVLQTCTGTEDQSFDVFDWNSSPSPSVSKAGSLKNC